MAKNKPSTKELFDVLNSEFSDKNSNVANTVKNSKKNTQPQYYNPPQYKYTPPTKQTQTKATKSEQSKKPDIENKSKAGDEVKGKSCCGFRFLQVLFILILAAIIAWIIFMPQGSLSELKEYVMGRFSQLAPKEENQIDLDLLSATTSSTITASTSATMNVTSTAEQTTSTVAAATMAVTSKSTVSTTKNSASKTKTTTSPTATNDFGYITVYLKSQIVVVYDKNGNVRNTFTCSSGKSSTPTRTGDYVIQNKYRWRLMIGNCYTQYASSFSNSYLFHSIPYNKQNASTMSNSSYDKLGTPASAGCIRLCCRDSKWIYDNCPIGTSVHVVNEYAPKGVTPLAIPSRIDDSAHSGWDPTDPAENNPYN